MHLDSQPRILVQRKTNKKKKKWESSASVICEVGVRDIFDSYIKGTSLHFFKWLTFGGELKGDYFTAFHKAQAFALCLE